MHIFDLKVIIVAVIELIHACSDFGIRLTNNTQLKNPREFMCTLRVLKPINNEQQNGSLPTIPPHFFIIHVTLHACILRIKYIMHL